MKKLFAVLAMALMVMFAAVPTQAATTGQAVTDEGANYLLDIVFQDIAVESFRLELFCNDLAGAIADTHTFASFTACTGGVGETPKVLTRGAGWTLSGTAPAQAAFTQQDFSFTGDLTTNATIYGYCIINNASAITIGCEALTSSFQPHNGYHLYITPTVKLSKGTAS